MTDAGWHQPGGETPGPYGAPPPPPPPPPVAPGQSWDQVPGSPSDPARVAWQQPVYGGQPPPPGPPRWPIVALLGALALLVAAIVGVIVTSDSDDETVTDDPVDTSSPSTTGDTDTDDGSDDPDRQPSGDPDAFVDEAVGYELTLPAGWAFTGLHADDTEGAGARMFPDDAEKAQLAQQTVGVLPRIISFYGVLSDEVGVSPFVTNVNINVTSVPGTDGDYDTLADQLTSGIEIIGGATVNGDEPFTLAGADGVKLDFDYSAEVGASGVQYAVLIDGQLWVLNFASADVPAHADEFDAIAASFRVYE